MTFYSVALSPRLLLNLPPQSASAITGTESKAQKTDESSRQSHWVGATLVEMMVDALFNNALENRTYNWDFTVVRALSLILITSLQCRSGDITKSYLDNQPLPFLTYGDVCLKLVNGTEIEHLEARIKIRNEKGHK